MSDHLNGGPGAGNIKAQRGLATSNLLIVIFVLILALNIPLLLGFQMLFVYGDNPIDSFETAPILSERVPFNKIYTNQVPSEVYAHLVAAEDDHVKLVITEKHPWLNAWHTVKTFDLGPDDNDFTTRVMCDVGFVSITVTERDSFSNFTITQSVHRIAGLQIPFIYVFILIFMIIMEIIAVVVVRKLKGY